MQSNLNISGEPYDPELRESVAFLGAYGTIEALGMGNVLQPGDRVRGLPPVPVSGADALRLRTSLALQDLVDRFPVDHIMIGPDVMLLSALRTTFDLPVSILLPNDAAPEVHEHFEKVADSDVDIERLPQLPRPRGNLPALVMLGFSGISASYVHPDDKFLMDLVAARVLGLTFLIDPNDVDVEPVPGWTSVWSPQFSGIYVPAALAETETTK